MPVSSRELARRYDEAIARNDRSAREDRAALRQADRARAAIEERGLTVAQARRLDEEGHMNVTFVRPHERRGTSGVRGHERRIAGSGILPMSDGVTYVGYVRFGDGSAFESGPVSEAQARAFVRRNGGTVRR